MTNIISIMSIVVIFVIAIIFQLIIVSIPVTHAEFPGEDYSGNAFNQKVPSNNWARTFWTLLL